MQLIYSTNVPDDGYASIIHRKLHVARARSGHVLLAGPQKLRSIGTIRVLQSTILSQHQSNHHPVSSQRTTAGQQTQSQREQSTSEKTVSWQCFITPASLRVLCTINLIIKLPDQSPLSLPVGQMLIKQSTITFHQSNIQFQQCNVHFLNTDWSSHAEGPLSKWPIV